MDLKARVLKFIRENPGCLVGEIMEGAKIPWGRELRDSILELSREGSIRQVKQRYGNVTSMTYHANDLSTKRLIKG